MVSRTFCAHLILWLASSSLARVQNFTITSQDWKSRLTANFSFDANVPCTYSDCVVEPYTSKALTHNWRRGISTVVTDRSVDLEFYGQAIYVFFALPKANEGSDTRMSLVLSVDGTRSESVYDADNTLVYSNTSLELGRHKLQLTTTPLDVLSFDYMIYTTDVAENTIDRPTIGPSSRSITNVSKTLLSRRELRRRDLHIPPAISGTLIALIIVAVLCSYLRKRLFEGVRNVDPVVPGSWVAGPCLERNVHLCPALAGASHDGTAPQCLGEGVVPECANRLAIASDSQRNSQGVQEVLQNVNPSPRQSSGGIELSSSRQVSLKGVDATRNKDREEPTQNMEVCGSVLVSGSRSTGSISGLDSVQRQIVGLHQEVGQLRSQFQRFQNSDPSRIDDPPPMYN